MRSIQCLLDRLAERRAFRVLDHHASPRQRLERNPVQADCATKRENHNNATDAVKHVADAIRSLLVRQTTEAGSSPASVEKRFRRVAFAAYQNL